MEAWENYLEARFENRPQGEENHCPHDQFEYKETIQEGLWGIRFLKSVLYLW